MDGTQRDERVCALLAFFGVALGAGVLVSGVVPPWVFLGAFGFVVGLPLALVGLTRRVLPH